MVSQRSVAVLGAGMAGAAAARGLHDAGFRVRVFDKGRGAGGRLATRRAADGLAFDHGAQYLTARDPAFSQVVERWREAGVAEAWGEPGWFVGRPGMAALPRALLEGIEVATGCTVARIARDDDGWALRDGDGLPVATGQRFDAVLLSCPTPQTETLLASAGAAAAWPEFGAGCPLL